MQEILCNAVRLKQIKNGTNGKKIGRHYCKGYDYALENARESTNMTESTSKEIRQKTENRKIKSFPKHQQ